jgi:uncharacterized protein YbjT (DUF2867 family)
VVHELTGPRAVTFAEAVELISRASALPITYKQVAPAEYTTALVGARTTPTTSPRCSS